MFCPNCAARRVGEQNFCRSCGLEFGQVVLAIVGHGPSRERAAMERRRERVERLGYLSLSVAGVIAVSLVLAIAGYYKLVLLGPEVLLGSAVGALVGFVLLALGFLGYSKFFLIPARSRGEADLPAPRPSATPPPAGGELAEPATPTNRLIADKPIDDIPSVTEHSTERLERQPRGRRD